MLDVTCNTTASASSFPVLSEQQQSHNMATTIIYHLCHIVIDLVLCVDIKELLTLLSSQNADISVHCCFCSLLLITASCFVKPPHVGHTHYTLSKHCTPVLSLLACWLILTTGQCVGFSGIQWFFMNLMNHI